MLQKSYIFSLLVSFYTQVKRESNNGEAQFTVQIIKLFNDRTENLIPENYSGLLSVVIWATIV